MSNLPKTGKIACLDLGSKVTGLAVSDARQQLGFVRDEIKHSSDDMLVNSVLNLIESESLFGLLIGLPLGWEGEDSRQTKWVRGIAAQLEKHIPVHLIDESLSTQNTVSHSKLQRKDSEVALNLLLEYFNAG